MLSIEQVFVSLDPDFPQCLRDVRGVKKGLLAFSLKFMYFFLVCFVLRQAFIVLGWTLESPNQEPLTMKLPFISFQIHTSSADSYKVGSSLQELT